MAKIDLVDYLYIRNYVKVIVARSSSKHCYLVWRVLGVTKEWHGQKCPRQNSSR